MRQETTTHGLVQEDSTTHPTAEHRYVPDIRPITSSAPAFVFDRHATWQKARIYCLTRYDWRCASCGVAEGVDVHHMIPRSEGGGNDQNNLIPLCRAHHARAHRMYRQWQKVNAEVWPAVYALTAAMSKIMGVDDCGGRGSIVYDAICEYLDECRRDGILPPLYKRPDEVDWPEVEL